LNTHWYNLSCNQTTDYLIAKFVRLHKFQIRSISITPHKLINGLQNYLEDLGAPTEDFTLAIYTHQDWCLLAKCTLFQNAKLCLYDYFYQNVNQFWQ